jgi:hypothetical protein
MFFKKHKKVLLATSLLVGVVVVGVVLYMVRPSNSVTDVQLPQEISPETIEYKYDAVPLPGTE